RQTGGLGGRTLVYFTAIGLAFLFVEVTLLQRFLLFLGHPVYTAAIVLSGFLLFAGLGSALAGPLGRQYPPRWLVALAAAVIALVSGLYGATLGPLFTAAAGLAMPLKALIGFGMIAPMALAMGFPFPLALQRLDRDAPNLVPWAWAVNGCASVLSAVLASLLAIHWGFAAVLGAAAGLYLLAAAAFPEIAPEGGIPPGA
ncbi:MAG TPA: SAM-dependent methyltransferase, partial [Gammaproteobacteria bacterium]|nr:SAM-dependent methyltransferase [Gammaproteobacteria bacterium]